MDLLKIHDSLVTLAEIKKRFKDDIDPLTKDTDPAKESITGRNLLKGME